MVITRRIGNTLYKFKIYFDEKGTFNLIRMALEEDGEKRAAIFSGIIEEIKRYRVPIRPDRRYERATAVRKTKFSLNYKVGF